MLSVSLLTIYMYDAIDFIFMLAISGTRILCDESLAYSFCVLFGQSMYSGMFEMSIWSKTPPSCFSKRTGHLSVNAICRTSGHEGESEAALCTGQRYGRRQMSPLGVGWCVRGCWCIRRDELTFPAAMSDRPSWCQRWNSLNANFMARSRHCEEMQTCKCVFVIQFIRMLDA